jgi:hypothetical protein
MATIRLAKSAGAALIALMAIAPAASQAQAPLQLTPGPNQAKRTTNAGTAMAAATKKVAKPRNRGTLAGTPKTSSRRNSVAAHATPSKTAARKTTATARANKSARPNTRKLDTRKTERSIASGRQREHATNRARTGVATVLRANRSVPATDQPALPVADQPAALRAILEPPVVAQGDNENVATDHVMRGSHSVSLVGMLPWWRNNRMQDVSYGSEAAQSQVMAAADAWLAAHGGGRAVSDDDAADTTAAIDRADTDQPLEIADANEVNEIDLTAPPEPSFLQSLISMISGAVAAAAASAKLLFS